MRRGFSVVELIVVLAIIGTLVGMVTPFLLRTKSDTDLAETVVTVAQIMRKAQTYAQGSRNTPASMWAVTVTDYGQPSGFKAVLCPGFHCFGYVGQYAEVTPLPAGITLTGSDSYSFDALSGMPFPTGTTTYSNSFGRTATIFVNSEGMITYGR